MGDVSRSTELSSLSGRGILATFPVLPSFRPYRDVEYWQRFPFYRALAPDGAIRDRCGFTQTVHRGGMSRRDNSSVRRNDHDEHLVPQGHKPGRRSPPGGHLVPKGHELGRRGISDRSSMPLQGRNMSRRDTSSVETAPSEGTRTPLQGRNLISSPNCPCPDSEN